MAVPVPSAYVSQDELNAILGDALPRQGAWTDEDYLWLTDRSRRLIEFTDGTRSSRRADQVERRWLDAASWPIYVCSMPYDPVLVQPMRDELTAVGIEELETAEAVDRFLADKSGSSMIVINSVCGCAAGSARPGIKMALRHEVTPDRVATVFAGQDLEATATARGYIPHIPPSSPSVALFRNGELVFMYPRHQIEGRPPQVIAADLTAAFDEHLAS